MRRKYSKTFMISAAHRIWRRSTNPHLERAGPDFTGRIHGHNFKIKVTLRADDTDYAGMVCNPANLEWFRELLCDCYAHRTLLDASDPELGDIIGEPAKAAYDERLQRIASDGVAAGQFHQGHFSSSPDTLLDASWHFYALPDGEVVALGSVAEDAERTLHASFVVLPFMPTAENLANMFYEVIVNKLIMSGACEGTLDVLSVEVSETESTTAAAFLDGL